MGNDVQAMLLKGRAFTALLSVMLGLIVYFWSRRLFGPIGGMISLARTFSTRRCSPTGAWSPPTWQPRFLHRQPVGLSVMVNRVTAATVLASAFAMAGLFL